MYNACLRRGLIIVGLLFGGLYFLHAQDSFKPKYNNASIHAGIEVGSKGVKMSIIEVGKGAFTILKDTSVNTDFITFSPATSEATLNQLTSLYTLATKQYKIPAKRIHTVVSSGVKMQSEKENKTDMVNTLISSFRDKVHEPERTVAVVNVLQEARLSHLGIVPESRRYNTFLIDIGSGNTKGGYFPKGNTEDFYLFQLNWGTKSTANATEKRLEGDNSLSNYNKQLARVLAGAENSEIIYAVNASGAYPLSDNIAFSGGIVWSVATLMFPELIDNPVVPVNFDDVIKFSERLLRDFNSLTEESIVKNIKDKNLDLDAISKEVKRVHSVFDQKSLMSGTGLLIKIMRQFASVFETKQFYLVKNGQVGWISAYVDEETK